MGVAVPSVTVVAKLMPNAGFRISDFTETARITQTVSDSNGLWYLDLERNANLTPDHSWYEISEFIPDASGGKRVWNIAVGDSDQSLLASLVTPAQQQPTVVPAGTVYLTQAAADARYQALGSFDTPGSIQPDDTVSAGVSSSAARADHRHGITAATAGTIEPDDAAAEGVATSFSRSDHKHGITAAAPTTVDLDGSGSNSEGVATSFARSDHKHAAENDAWTGWTPSVVQGVTPSQTVVSARYIRIGRTIIASFSMSFQSAGSGATQITMTLPVAAQAGSAYAVGSYRYFDAGSTNIVGSVNLLTSTTVNFYRDADGNAVGLSAPTIANGDLLLGTITYEAAS